MEKVSLCSGSSRHCLFMLIDQALDSCHSRVHSLSVTSWQRLGCTQVFKYSNIKTQIGSMSLRIRRESVNGEVRRWTEFWRNKQKYLLLIDTTGNPADDEHGQDKKRQASWYPGFHHKEPNGRAKTRSLLTKRWAVRQKRNRQKRFTLEAKTCLKSVSEMTGSCEHLWVPRPEIRFMMSASEIKCQALRTFGSVDEGVVS